MVTTASQYFQPQKVKVFDGKSNVLEEAIKGTYAFVEAFKATD